MTINEKKAELVAGIGLSIPLAFGGLAFRAYVLMLMAGWFVCEPFGLPSLQWLQSVGLLLICAVLRPYRESCSKEKHEHPGAAVLGNVLAHGYALPASWLLLGWIVHQNMASQ